MGLALEGGRYAVEWFSAWVIKVIQLQGGLTSELPIPQLLQSQTGQPESTAE